MDWPSSLAGGAKKCAGLSYEVILGREHRVRKWAGKGGRAYDDYRRVIEKLKIEKHLTLRRKLLQRSRR